MIGKFISSFLIWFGLGVIIEAVFNVNMGIGVFWTGVLLFTLEKLRIIRIEVLK